MQTTSIEIEWIFDLTDSIEVWLKGLMVEPGRFLFSKEGNLIPPTDTQGLGASSMAMKLAAQIGIWERFTPDVRQAWVDYIRRFQKERTGYFEDRAVLKAADKRAGFWWFQKHVGVRRSETRQAVAALRGVGEWPLHPVKGIPTTPDTLRQEIHDLGWHSPWHAGSQTSHLVFFYVNNRDAFGHDTQPLINTVLQELDSLHNPETGAWHIGDPPLNHKVNGAMKVLTIYTLLEKPFNHAGKLIDLALLDVDDRDACHSLDVLVVLHAASRHTDHRHEEVLAFVEYMVDSIGRHRRDDGALSFFPGGAGIKYYGIDTTRGLPESDVRGTHLLIWALTLCAEMLGFSDDLGWTPPYT